jgi:hypothetical protein
MLLVLILLQFRVLSSFAESAFYPHLRNPRFILICGIRFRNPRFILICEIRFRNPLPQSAFRFRVLSQPVTADIWEYAYHSTRI